MASGITQVVNETPYPTSLVRRIVLRHMRLSGEPRQVVVKLRRSKTDDRLGFYPFDPSAPITLWVEPADRYPQPGAKTWWEELGISAAHEDWHRCHPEEGCGDGGCERRAEGHGMREWRTRRP
jgi:hypothetical protein